MVGHKGNPNIVMRKSADIQITIKRKIGRPKKTWLEAIMNDLNIRNLIEENALNSDGEIGFI